MNINRTTIGNEANTLLKDKSWKSPVIVGVIALVILILLDSILFSLVLGLVKLALLIGGLVLLVRGAYLAYPTLLKKYKEKSMEK